MRLTLVDKGRVPDREDYFRRYRDEDQKEVNVMISSAAVSEFKQQYGCDLETLASYAAEEALKSGIEGNVELVGLTYLAVRKRLQELKGK